MDVTMTIKPAVFQPRQMAGDFADRLFIRGGQWLLLMLLVVAVLLPLLAMRARAVGCKRR
jgi:iron(III) transport system permease protein